MKRVAVACSLLIALCVLTPPRIAAQQRDSRSIAGSESDPQQQAAESPTQAADNVETQPGTPAAEADNEGGKTREQRLADYLSGIKFVGKFTVDGKQEASPKTEEYTISKCEKLAEENMYRLTARIKYGDVNSEVPLDLKILWAGSTPVITLDSFWIPGMGTFDARVMIHADRYAGTWQHDQVGGLMFGRLEK